MGAVTASPRPADGSLGDWINQRLQDHTVAGTRAGSVVPTGFARVVRVLHPAGDGRSWAEVAQANGRVVHPLVQWWSIAPHADAGSGRSLDVDPEEGSAPEDTLAAILDHCPSDVDLVHAVWDGFGAWADRDFPFPLMPGWGGRSYRLFVAARGAWTHWPGMEGSWPQSANLIWPHDHSWCIATEIDWDSTLVACTDEVADALLADGRLETFDVGFDDDLSWHGDLLHPRPPWLA